MGYRHCGRAREEDGRVLNRASEDDRPFDNCLPDHWRGQRDREEVTQQDLDNAEQHAGDPE
jgi:hypothetical protein